MTYLQERRGSSAALGVAVALNGGALIAALAWNPSFVTTFIDPPIETIQIRPLDPPPPPPQPSKPVETKVTRTNPVVTAAGEAGPIILDPIKPIEVEPPRQTVLPPPPQPVEPATPPPVARVAPALDPGRSQLQPPYPPALQREGKEGSVTVRIRIGTDGRPLAIELLRADDPRLFAATQGWGMRHWRFKPATEDGRPVESSTTLTVRFELQR